MKKRLFLTTAFVAIFGCFVSMADVHDRDYRGNGKGHKTERVDKKGDKKHDSKKDKVNKNHKPVAHRPHKPAHKPVCHVKHHHKVECHKRHCNKVVFNPFDPFSVRAFTTAAVVAAILD